MLRVSAGGYRSQQPRPVLFDEFDDLRRYNRVPQDAAMSQAAKEVVKDLVPRPLVVTLIVLAVLTVLFLVMR